MMKGTNFYGRMTGHDGMLRYQWVCGCGEHNSISRSYILDYDKKTDKERGYMPYCEKCGLSFNPFIESGKIYSEEEYEHIRLKR